jgi:aminoglycoside phosphotransferase family enzyme
VAEFHAGAQRAPVASGFASPSYVLEMALANFAELLPRAMWPSDRAALRALRRWTRREHAAIRDALELRQQDGAIRECHGDLHLGNVALVENRITVFDCLEFNEAMRWIDTMSEVAFTVMDLEHRGRAHLARRFLSAYLERSGDYHGARVLRFYLVYRALVRAKVAMLRASQLPQGVGQDALQSEFSSYVHLAASYAGGAHPWSP